MKSFEGFEAADFAAYTPDKWSSNLHNLPRMQVKQKLSALAGRLQDAVTGLSLSLEDETSSERPSIWNQKKVDAQWLFYARDGKARKELQSIIDRHKSLAENIEDPAHHHRHAILAVRVDGAGASVLFGLHRSAWLDRHNLERKWANEYERPKLLRLLEGLQGEPYIVRLGGTSTPIDDLDEARLDASLASAAQLDGWFSIERTFAPDSTEVMSDVFIQSVADVLQRLAPVYRFTAWSRENDFADIAQQVVKEKKEKRRSGNAPFGENDKVLVIGGLFSGQQGVVLGFDRAGKVKVKVGTLTLPISAGALKLLPP